MSEGGLDKNDMEKKTFTIYTRKTRKFSSEPNRSQVLTDFLQALELLPITQWTSSRFRLFTALTLSHMPNSSPQNEDFLLILSTSDVGTCLPIYDIKSDA